MSEEEVRAIVRDEVRRMVREMVGGLVLNSGTLQKLAEQQGNN